jgi:DNA helicase II / ATP-dependent DNA helicase PcrA
MKFLDGLNSPQREAAAHVEGPMLILAGAGSGKTRVITQRMAHLVAEHGVPGYAILGVTFTNKAAGEMRERVQKLLGATAGSRELPQLSTFHSFCVRLLRRDGARLADIRPQFTTQFTIYDDDDQISLLRQIYRHYGWDEKTMQYRAALGRISSAKSSSVSPQELHTSAKDIKAQRLAKIYESYEERLQAANALDFDDLLIQSVRLLRHDEDTRRQCNDRYRFLMVDEYQDTNRLQYELMRLLTKGHSNVVVVGDEDQSIYGWRGADIRNILDFEKDYPDAKVVRLEQNYRSTKNIIEAASAVISRNTSRMGKTLWSDGEDGERIGIYEAFDAENEALFIADTIDRTLGRTPDERVAILYRTNAQSRPIEEALRRYGRKYVVIGGLSFYQRAEIKDMMAYLRLCVHQHDSIAFLRIINTPARGIGKTTTDLIEQTMARDGSSAWTASETLTGSNALNARAITAVQGFLKMMNEFRQQSAELALHDLLSMVLDQSGYGKALQEQETVESESKLQNLQELLNAAEEAAGRGEDLPTFLDHAALVADADLKDKQAQISLLTIHNAKGLEFPIVFLAGLEDGLFPSSRSTDTPEKLEEERRLMYVGMTRAEKTLYVSWARTRRRFGGGPAEPSLPSRFLLEIPKAMQAKMTRGMEIPQVDLLAEAAEVRQAVQKNIYTGKTYNSLENIRQFFAERQPSAAPAPAKSVSKPVVPPAAPAPAPVMYPPRKADAPPALAPKREKQVGIRAGATVVHPKFGRGTILRREGDGDDARLTISFPRAGLKKLVQKYADIQVIE